MENKLSKTQEAFRNMVKIIQSIEGKIQLKNLEDKVKSTSDYTQGHINGASNLLRKKCKDYGISYQRIGGNSYFEYVEDEEKPNFRHKLIEQTASFLESLNDMKKDVDTVSDFKLLQSFINRLQEDFNNLKND